MPKKLPPELIARLLAGPVMRTPYLRKALNEDNHVGGQLRPIAKDHGCVLLRINIGKRFQTAFQFRSPRPGETAGDLIDVIA